MVDMDNLWDDEEPKQLTKQDIDAAINLTAYSMMAGVAKLIDEGENLAGIRKAAEEFCDYIRPKLDQTAKAAVDAEVQRAYKEEYGDKV